MKPTFKQLITTILASLATVGSPLAAPLEPRTDINPALLYYQAFSVFPDQDEAMGAAFHFDGWPVGPLGTEDVAVARRLDPSFRLIHRATQMTVPCDWGFDLADGPEMVIPNLVKLRVATYAAALRSRVALDEGRSTDARVELISMLHLARRSAVDGALVQVMIEVAIENILVEFVANHFDRFSNDDLRQLLTEVGAAPPRITTATAMATERRAFYEWLIDKLAAIDLAHPGNDETALREARRFVAELFALNDEELAPILAEANGTMSGFIDAIRNLSPLYDGMIQIASASPDQLEGATEQFQKLREKHANAIAEAIVPNISKARRSELKHVAKLAMLQAATAYRINGPAGLEEVTDPLSNGPFQARAITLPDGRKGFELQSTQSDLIEDARQVFVGTPALAAE